MKMSDGGTRIFSPCRSLRHVDGAPHVVEAAHAGVVDARGRRGRARAKSARMRATRLAVHRAAHVLHRVEHIGQGGDAGQRECIVERREVDAGQVDRAEAGHVDGVLLAPELARVVDADAEFAAGRGGQLLADPAHRLHGRVTVTCTSAACSARSDLSRGGARVATAPPPASAAPCVGSASGARLRVPGCVPRRDAGHRAAAQRADPVESPAPRFAGQDVVDAARRAGADVLARHAAAGRGVRSEPARTRAHRAALGQAPVPPRPTLRPSMNVSQVMPSRTRCRQSSISGPSSRPALLPKSEMTTAGPRSLIVASGLLAGSTPTCMLPTTAAASSSVQVSWSAGASAPSRKTYSASTAAKPPAKTGHGHLFVEPHVPQRPAEDRPDDAFLAVDPLLVLGNPADFPAHDLVGPQRDGLVLAAVSAVDIRRNGARIMVERGGGLACGHESLRHCACVRHAAIGTVDHAVASLAPSRKSPDLVYRKPVSFTIRRRPVRRHSARVAGEAHDDTMTRTRALGRGFALLAHASCPHDRDRAAGGLCRAARARATAALPSRRAGLGRAALPAAAAARSCASRRSPRAAPARSPQRWRRPGRASSCSRSAA